MDTTDANVIPYHKSNRGRAVKSDTKPTKKVPAKKAPERKKAAGRKAFQGDYCEIHSGLDENGNRYIRWDDDGNEIFGGQGCAKFSHLRTDGLGIHRMPFYRTFLVVLTRAIKPLFIVAFALGSILFAYHFIGGALHFDHSVPKPTNGGVSNNVRPSPSNSISSGSTKHSNPATSGNTHPTTTGQVKK